MTKRVDMILRLLERVEVGIEKVKSMRLFGDGLERWRSVGLGRLGRCGGEQAMDAGDWKIHKHGAE